MYIINCKTETVPSIISCVLWVFNWGNIYSTTKPV